MVAVLGAMKDDREEDCFHKWVARSIVRLKRARQHVMQYVGDHCVAATKSNEERRTKDHRAGADRAVHPEASAGPVRPQGPQRRGLI